MTPSPVTQIDLVEASPGHIALLWQPVSDARDYKIYWDKGDRQQTALYYPLINTTSGANQVEVSKTSSGGILGTPQLYANGGQFNFKVSYISITSGSESEMSAPFTVNVAA